MPKGDMEGRKYSRPGEKEKDIERHPNWGALRGQRPFGSYVYVHFLARSDSADVSESVKSNLLSVDIPQDQRLSDDDILNNVNTIMFAGSDTSSLSLTWALWLLMKNPEVQDRLHQELSAVHCPESFDDPLSDEIDSLYGNVLEFPYPDKVFKEALRLVPPVHSSPRVAGQDDVIPTSQPYKIQKPWRSNHGHIAHQGGKGDDSPHSD